MKEAIITPRPKIMSMMPTAERVMVANSKMPAKKMPTPVNIQARWVDGVVSLEECVFITAKGFKLVEAHPAMPER